MFSIILGSVMASFGLIRYLHMGVTYKHIRKEIAGYDLHQLSPEKELNFILYTLVSRITPFVNGLIILAINLGIDAYDELAVNTFTLILAVLTLSTELVFNYYLLPRVYYKYKGVGKRVKRTNSN